MSLEIQLEIHSLVQQTSNAEFSLVRIVQNEMLFNLVASAAGKEIVA
jgi:hypothetical protein